MSEDSMDYDIKDCVWNDKAHTSFACLWTHPDLGEIPFAAHKDDADPTGRALFAWAAENAKIAEPAPEAVLAEARAAAIADVNHKAGAAKTAPITTI